DRLSVEADQLPRIARDLSSVAGELESLAQQLEAVEGEINAAGSQARATLGTVARAHRTIDDTARHLDHLSADVRQRSRLIDASETGTYMAALIPSVSVDPLLAEALARLPDRL